LFDTTAELDAYNAARKVAPVSVSPRPSNAPTCEYINNPIAIPDDRQTRSA